MKVLGGRQSFVASVPIRLWTTWSISHGHKNLTSIVLFLDTECCVVSCSWNSLILEGLPGKMSRRCLPHFFAGRFFTHALSLPDKHGVEITMESAASQLVFRLIFLESPVQRGKQTKEPLCLQSLVTAMYMFLLPLT